ncbi:hypothetical protein BCV69DRAFT_284806, partial [Microstroma glucosiphilum]
MDRRRQVLSYSDALAAPSGDVDLEAPLPSLRPNGVSSSASTSRLSKPNNEVHSPYEMSWPQAPLYSAPQPQQRVEPLTLAPLPAYVPGPASATYPPPPHHLHHNGPHSSPYPGPAFAPPYYSGPPPPMTAPYQQSSQFQLNSHPYPPAPYVAPASASAIPTGPKGWVGRQSQLVSSGAGPSSYHYHDSGPGSFPRRRYGTPTFTARRPNFPSQTGRVVIEDCDASSDEEDDADEVGETSSQSLRKSIRSKTLEDVAILWKKAQGVPPALISATGSGNSSPAPHSAESTEYEKKQAQIKMMTEKIRQLEAARKKAREAVTVELGEQQEVRQNGAPTPSVPAIESVPDAIIGDQVVMAALPVEYGGSISKGAESPVESGQPKDSFASSSAEPSASTSSQPSPKPLQPAEGSTAQSNSPSSAPTTLRKPSEDLEEGEYAEGTETASASPSAPSTRKLVLNPQLAEQKRKLLEAMKRKTKSDPVMSDETLPSPIILKRKADDEADLSTAPDVEPSISVSAPAPASDATFAEPQIAPAEEISSKRLKRQRKKARQRAAAAALSETSSARKSGGEVEDSKREEVDKSEVSRPSTGRSQEDHPICCHTVHLRSLLGLGIL